MSGYFESSVPFCFCVKGIDGFEIGVFHRREFANLKLSVFTLGTPTRPSTMR